MSISGLDRPRSRLTVAVSVALACVCLIGSAGNALAASRGVLSGAEYQQLKGAQQRIRALSSANDQHRLSRDAVLCRRIDAVSTLIGAVKRGCLALVKLAGDDQLLNSRATKCGINPASEAALLTCLVPAVKRYHADAEAFYRAETHVVTIARQRGFSSRCVSVIADSPSNISAVGQLASDLSAAVTALQHQDPSALQNLSVQIQSVAKSFKPSPHRLAACPHR